MDSAFVVKIKSHISFMSPQLSRLALIFTKVFYDWREFMPVFQTLKKVPIDNGTMKNMQ
jgi:hypothetical protein